MALANQRFDEALAEQTFRADLKERPNNGWALRGLARALKAQGQTAAAATQRAVLDKSWAVADASLRAQH